MAREFKVSKIIPFAIIILIPVSWVVAMLYSNHIMNIIINSNIDQSKIDAIVKLNIKLPVAELLTFATVVIPAIMVRKAVREGTENMRKRDKLPDISE